MGDATPTLYEWAGGRPAIGAMLEAFYDLVEADDLLAPVFDGLVTREHRDHVTTWWSEVLGGPADRRVRHAPGDAQLAARRRRRAPRPVPRWGWGVAPPYRPSDG